MRKCNFLFFVVFFFMVLGVLPTTAQNLLTNGSMNLSSGNANSTAPNGWLVSAPTPDVNSPGTSNSALPGIDGHTFVNPIGASPDGGQAVGIAVYDNDFEAIGQSIALTGGQAYTINFHWANSGLLFAPSIQTGNNSSYIIFELNGTEIGRSSANTQGSSWYTEAINFTATASGTAQFVIKGGYEGSAQWGIYLSIDGVSITPQAEPEPQCTDPNLYADNCDFDGDGILNGDDLDDDNDGILDTEECGTTIISTEEVAFAGRYPTATGHFFSADDPSIPDGWTLTSGSAHVSSLTLLQGVPAALFQWIPAVPVTPEGNNIFLGIGDNEGIASTITGLTPGANYDFSIHLQSSRLPNGTASVNYATGVTLILDGTTYNLPVPSSAWTTETVNFTASSSTVNFELRDPVPAGSSMVNFEVAPLSVQVNQEVAVNCDAQFLTDSDGDGCPDAIEGGATFTPIDLAANNMLTGGVDGNGVPLVVGTNGQPMGDSQDAGVTSACVIPQLTNTCPTSGVDLANRVAAANLPAGTVLTVHNGLPVSNGNRVNTPNSITTTGTYYLSFYDAESDCYSPPSEVEVVVEECCRMVKPGISFANEE